MNHFSLIGGIYLSVYFLEKLLKLKSLINGLQEVTLKKSAFVTARKLCADVVGWV